MRREDEKRNRCSLSLSREDIWREELIEGEGERFAVELALSSRMTRRAKAKEIFRLAKMAFQTSTLGETMLATIEFVVVEKKFDSGVIFSTQTEINIITETEKIPIVSTDLMISNG
jgi:hypothetical protein